MRPADPDGVFYAWTRLAAAGNLRSSDTFHQEEDRTMGLFRRKQLNEEEGERCPNCRERVPEGADICMMCGLRLTPFRGRTREPDAKRRVASG